MTSTKTLLAAVAVLAISAPAMFASAQTAAPAAKPKPVAAARPATTTAARPAATTPTAPAAPPLQLGPPIPGVCVFSEEVAVSRSTAGESINKRMQQLGAQVQAELGPEQTSLDADIKAFQASAASLPADQQQTKGQALQKRMQDFDGKRTQRQKELELTLRKAIARVDAELDPIVRNVVTARTCSILLKADTAIYAANPGMDITSSVIEQLNVKMPAITFDREHLDQQAAAGQQR